MNDFEKALQLTMQLHALFKQGMGDSAEADKLRDQLDTYGGWAIEDGVRPLSQEHRELLNRVSAALYHQNSDQ